MKKRNSLLVLAAVGATLALGVPAAISASGVKTTVTIGAVGYQGKVSAANIKRARGLRADDRMTASSSAVHTPEAACQFNWTEISLDTPGSSIVTP